MKFLAIFVTRGGQDIIALDRADAIKQGERAARRLDTQLADVVGPDDDEDGDDE